MATRPPKPRAERLVGRAEKALWRFITRHDTPLHEPFEENDEEEVAGVGQETSPPSTAAPDIILPKPRTEPTLRPIRMGDYAGVDGRLASRFRRGKLPIDLCVDLHGMNQIDAYELLQQSVTRVYGQGKRVMLVITGKGNRTQDGLGVLRQKLPLWLNEAPINPFILAFDQANAEDGGAGAFYVLLKRQREM